MKKIWFLLGASCVFSGILQAKWVEVPGAGDPNIVDSYRFHIKIGNAQNIWGRKNDGTPYKWSGNKWELKNSAGTTQQPLKLREIAPAKDGTVYGLGWRKAIDTGDRVTYEPKHNLYEWNGNVWNKIAEIHKPDIWITALGKSNILVTGHGEIQKFNVAQQKSEKSAAQLPKNLTSLSIGVDGSIWAVSMETIYPKGQDWETELKMSEQERHKLQRISLVQKWNGKTWNTISTYDSHKDNKLAMLIQAGNKDNVWLLIQNSITKQWEYEKWDGKIFQKVSLPDSKEEFDLINALYVGDSTTWFRIPESFINKKRAQETRYKFYQWVE